jgi:tetratricopeptide (TPR) repeat protein
MSFWRQEETYEEVECGYGVDDLEVDPGNPDTHRRIERLEQAVAEQPGGWRNRVALARSFVQDGRFAEAARHLRTALTLVTDPTVLSALFFNLAICEENRERWDEAAAAYEQCVFLMPQLDWAHYGLGVCMRRLGNQAGAMMSLRRAVALNPDLEEGHQALAETYLEAGLLQETAAECRWLLEADPDALWPAQTLESLRRRLN